MIPNKYVPIHKLKKEILLEYYKTIEKDLEEIINAPSLLARVSKYYSMARGENNISYLVFYYRGELTFVKEYNFDKFSKQILFRNIVQYIVIVAAFYRTLQNL